MIRVCAAAIVVATSSLACAELVPNDIAARTELHAVQTLTLSDSQFLKGDGEAKAVTTTGKLRLAQGNSRLPVVMLMHGSGGMGANIEFWERELNTIGVSTFALDGFTARGLTQTSSNQALLGRLNFILDIYRGLDVLAKHPRVDPQRIVLMGFSRGGQAALYASLKRFHQLWNRSGVEFAAYIAFYPDCATTFVSDTEVADRPIRIFGGSVDDYNPIALCQAYAETAQDRRPRRAGGRVPERTACLRQPARRHHARPSRRNRKACAGARSSKGRLGCWSTQPAGSRSATRMPCVERGPHVGHDPDATRQVKQAVTGIVKGVFKLN